MKTLFKHILKHIWKAIAFLAAVITMTFCSSCEEVEPLNKATVLVSPAQNIITCLTLQSV